MKRRTPRSTRTNTLFPYTTLVRSPLREGVGNGGCVGAKVRAAKPVVWRFWQDDARVAKFAREGWKTSVFLAQWLTLAFLIESLMVAYVPAEWIAGALGGEGLLPLITATVVGVPAYLNGYAALRSEERRVGKECVSTWRFRGW